MTADGSGRKGPGPADFSRRRLLAGLGGLGAIGAASGAGTFAYLSDGETLPRNEIGAGEVALDVSCSDSNGNSGCTVSNGTVSYAPAEPIDRGDRGDVTFDVSVRSNPARLWFATTCPPTQDPLGDALKVSLKVGDDSVFPSGSLSELRREFVNGLRADDLDGDACLDPEGDALEIELAWELPEDAPAAAAGKTTAFEFQLYTEQCRHVSEDDADTGSNPYAEFGPCDEPEPECVDCDDGGKADGINGNVDLSDPNDISTWLTIDEGPLAGDAYLFVTEVDKDGNEAVGVRFELVDANGDPAERLCEVRIKGGNDTKTYPIKPPSNDTGEILYSPENNGGNLAGISNIQIDVCVDEDGENGDDDDDSGDCECGGNVRYRDLTFRYDGESDATIRVITQQTGGGNGVVFGDATIASGGTFTADGSDVPQTWGNVGTSLGQNTTIEIVDGGDEGASESVEIHTSCSEVLTIGDTFGSDGSGGTLYELVDGTFTDENALCDSEDLQ
ncbi:SipW-dependent-type signal peptide-containing protein [Halorubrum rubrum]|uniref:SipW-dependent-type signal peptide-containing protein n=1 Tax=Halorubrum rubrum TaxID=1126240 RepID=A0ABD5R0V3_9EURY|nr:SipW-dependent-type signal peptide-containing protein [Halorubrum rubrum]